MEPAREARHGHCDLWPRLRGCGSAACLAQAGHAVVGVDSNPGKAELINAGKSPVVEKDLDG